MSALEIVREMQKKMEDLNLIAYNMERQKD